MYQPTAGQGQTSSLQTGIDLLVYWPHYPSTSTKQDTHSLLASHVCRGLHCYATRSTCPWMAGQNDGEIFALFPVVLFSQRIGRALVSNAASQTCAGRAAFQQSASSAAWWSAPSCLQNCCWTSEKWCRLRHVLSFHHVPSWPVPIWDGKAYVPICHWEGICHYQWYYQLSLMVTNAFPATTHSSYAVLRSSHFGPFCQ